MDLYISAHEQAMICAGPVRGNQCPMPGEERFIDRVRGKEAGIVADVNTGSAG